MNSPRVRDRVSFLGLGFDSMNEGEVCAWLSDQSHGQEFGYIVTPNVDHVVRLDQNKEDKELWGSYSNAALCLCDSRILKKLARFSGVDLTLVPGSDLTARLLEDESFGSAPVAVVGGGTALIKKLAQQFPERTWLHHEPPMGVRTNVAAQRDIIKFVEERPASLFFFAIGSPQSELLCHQIFQRGRARGVALCVGASLEFVTGLKKRAPVWMQKASLEWLYRLLSEPSRLWRRYLIEGVRIFPIWWRLHPRANSDRPSS